MATTEDGSDVAAAAAAPVPPLSYYEDLFKAEATVWPKYMIVISSLTIVISIIGNGWVFICGITRKSLRESPFHIILVNKSLCYLLHSLIIFPGFINSLNSGMGEEKSGQVACVLGMMGHWMLISLNLCCFGFAAFNRALSSNPGWKISCMLCSKKATYGALTLFWVVSILSYFFIFLKHQDSFKGSFNCMIVGDYVENLLAGTEIRPMEPALTRTRDAMTSFVSIAILVTAFSYVIIINSIGSQSNDKKGDLGRTSMITALLFATFMSFWSPHIVGWLWNQDLLTENRAYPYLPMFGTALIPYLYVATMVEYRPPFYGGTNNKVVSATPNKT